MKKILITWASSYVGASIYQHLQEWYQTIGTYNSNKLFDNLVKCDITDDIQTKYVIQKHKPDTIIHIAANGNTKRCQQNPEQAEQINIQGTQNIIDAIQDSCTKVIFVSSIAAADNDSFYGQTKQKSETIVQTNTGGYSILRPSIFIGQSPNTVNNRFHNQLLQYILNKQTAKYDNHAVFQPAHLLQLGYYMDHIIQNNIQGVTIPVGCPHMIKSKYQIAKDILEDFGVKVEATTPPSRDEGLIMNFNTNHQLGFKQFPYDWMIHVTKKQIHQYLKNL